MTEYELWGPWTGNALHEPAPITRTPSLTFKAYGVMVLAVMAFGVAVFVFTN